MERHFLTAAEPCSAPRYGRSSRQSPRRSIWRMFASRVPGHPSRLRHTSVVYAKTGTGERTDEGVAQTSTSATAGSSSFSGSVWEDLLATDAPVTRAGSASDAGMLKRKGRLKEQDHLIEFILGMNGTHTPVEVMTKMERWISEHRRDPLRSQLRRMCPMVGRFHTPLALVEALSEYDEFFVLSRRKYVPPNFAEIRHILNIAQVHGIAPTVKMVTLDADGTIYQDGHHIEQDNTMIGLIVSLMAAGVHVAIVTAAGYPGDAAKFEHRVSGLLDAFRDLHLTDDVLSRFHIMGGECNYLLRCTSSYGLEFVPDDEWKSLMMLQWQGDAIEELLDDAQEMLEATAAKLRVPVQVIRKERAVGVVPMRPTVYEVLEELAITVQVHLAETRVPFCAFNGGNDVFVDVGNKSYGLEALMKYIGCTSGETLHVGDRFTLSGNDTATRDVCAILWVACPEETGFFLRLLLDDIRESRRDMYIE